MIKISDIFNGAGSTVLSDATTLFSQKWIAAPSADGKIKPGSGWQLGYETGWSTNADGTGQVNVTAINQGSEIAVYLMSDGVTNLGIQPPITVDDPMKGPLRITPRLLTAAERAKINTRPELSTQTWLSAAMVMDDALAPPVWMEIEAILPVGPGCWPAWWFKLRGQWPPEIDGFEVFDAALTTSLHSTVSDWQAALPATTNYVNRNGPDFSASQYISPTLDLSKPHRYGMMAYPDQIAIFVDRVCVQTWPMPADLAHAAIYPLIDFAIGATGSGAGTPPAGATSVGSMVVSAIDIRAMPAVYGGGVVPPPPPPPTGVTAAQVAALKAAGVASQAALARVASNAATLQIGLTRLTADTKAAQTALANVQALIAALKPVG